MNRHPPPLISMCHQHLCRERHMSGTAGSSSCPDSRKHERWATGLNGSSGWCVWGGGIIPCCLLSHCPPPLLTRQTIKLLCFFPDSQLIHAGRFQQQSFVVRINFPAQTTQRGAARLFSGFPRDTRKIHTPFIAEDTHFKAQVLRLSSRKHYTPDLMSETQRRTKGKHTERIPAAAAKLLPRRNPAQLRGAPLCLYLKTQRSGHEWRHSTPAWKHRQTQERCSSRP